MFNWLHNLVTLFVENILTLKTTEWLGSAIHFFIYDVIKIFILLSIMIFLISYIRSYFQPERTKQIITKFSGFKANIMASLLGIVTPFCSCSSVPLFIGFVEAGIPLGVTFSFLITSPIVNEAAFVLLLAAFGWKIALVYVAAGVTIGIVGGILIHVLKMEKHVEEYVYKIQTNNTFTQEMNKKDRINFAIYQVKFIIRKVWLFLFIGIAIGALIHSKVPADFLIKYTGNGSFLSTIAAVIIGIPLYSNAMGTIPIAEALIGKGVNIGTALAFMMAVTALSLPEMIILRKVIKTKLIASFAIITGTGIIIIGFIFNLIF